MLRDGFYKLLEYMPVIITRKRWDELTYRISRLEDANLIDVCTSGRRIEASDWCYTFWKRIKTPTSLKKMIELLCYHLGVMPWDNYNGILGDYYVTLIPREEFNKKMKESDFESVTRN